MQDATLWDMARRIPAALGRTFRLAWSVDRHMVVTVLVCQLLSGIGTAVMLASVADAMGPLFGSTDAAAGLHRAWPALTVAGVALGVGSTAWLVADWATRLPIRRWRRPPI